MTSSVPAAAAPFGADLRRPANAPFGCDAHPVGTFRVNNPDPTSCTWSSSGTLTVPSQESVIVPGDGVVTTVRVKTGPDGADGFAGSGPMQVVVLRSLGSGGGGPQCCLIAAVSQVFTPAANAVSTVVVNLPVENNTRGGISTLDSLGLSVLAPGVRIPAFYDGGNDLISTVFSPAVRLGTNNADRNGSSGAKLLINADWFPGAGVGVARGQVPVRDGLALVDLLCGRNVACRGLAQLVAPGAGAGAGAAAKPRVYATQRFNVARDSRKRLRLRLSKAGRALIARQRKTRLNLRTRLEDGSSETIRLTLVRP